MNSRLFLRFRRFLPTLALASLLGGCASTPESAPTPTSGFKEYTFEVQKSSNLPGSASQGKTIEFKAQCVSQSSDGSTLQLQFEPAYGGHGDASFGPDDKNGASQRLTPVISDGGNVVSVFGRKLSGIPFGSLRYLVAEVAATGPSKGSVTGLYFLVKGEDLVKCTKTSSGKYLTTFRQGGSTFTMTLDRLIGFDDEGKSGYNEPQRWSGESGTQIYLKNNEWFAEGIPSGPDGADFSFLETKSTRGDFD